MKTTATLVYAGMVRTPKRLHAYFELDDQGQIDVGQAQLFADPLVADAPIGAVYSFRLLVGKGPMCVLPARAKFVSMFTRTDLLTEWQARHDAVSTVAAAQASPPLDHLLQALAPIRTAYGKLPAPEQGILLAQVVRFIVGGGNT